VVVSVDALRSCRTSYRESRPGLSGSSAPFLWALSIEIAFLVG
jgi:hypothetical protein